VRIKVMSGMNIAESRAPQDGRISLHLQGRYIDFRVAAQPTTYGENVVLRILDKVQSLVALDGLGLAPDQFEALQLLRERADGGAAVIVTLQDPNLAERFADAALLIGDPALRVAISIAGNATLGADGELMCSPGKAGIKATETLHVYDVVQEWRHLTGLPAVLAVWAGRRESVTPEVIADFAASKEYGIARLAEIGAAASVEQVLPAADLIAYLRENIDFTLDSENLAGLELYYCLAAKLGLIARAKAVEWANVNTPRYASR